MDSTVYLSRFSKTTLCWLGGYKWELRIMQSLTETFSGSFTTSLPKEMGPFPNMASSTVACMRIPSIGSEVDPAHGGFWAFVREPDLISPSSFCMSSSSRELEPPGLSLAPESSQCSIFAAAVQCATTQMFHYSGKMFLPRV